MAAASQDITPRIRKKGMQYSQPRRKGYLTPFLPLAGGIFYFCYNTTVLKVFPLEEL